MLFDVSIDMRRFLTPAVAAAALAFVGPAQAATINVSIKSTGFSPATVTLNHGDAVTWKNNDRTNHQVVANDGSFASPIIGPGKTYTHTFDNAGTYPYHDAIKASLRGTIKVKGPPPSVTFVLSEPIVTFGTQITLSGQISTKKSGQNVALTAQEYGQPSPIALTTVVTGTDGTFGFVTTPKQYTTYVATWNKIASAPIIGQVEPKITLVPGLKGYMKTTVTAGRSFWHRHVYIQRLSQFGQWVNLAALTLGPQSGKIFKPTAYLPRGTSRIRIFLTVNQAGIGLLSGHSGTQTIRRP
jgi:plastocyanin